MPASSASRMRFGRISVIFAAPWLGVGDDPGLRAGVAGRAAAPRVQGDPEQRHRDPLARREQHVELARVGQVGDPRGHREQLVGRVAHRADHDDHAVARLAGVHDPVGHRLRCAPRSRPTCRRTSSRRWACLRELLLGDGPSVAAGTLRPGMEVTNSRSDAAAGPLARGGRDRRPCLLDRGLHGRARRGPDRALRGRAGPLPADGQLSEAPRRRSAPSPATTSSASRASTRGDCFFCGLDPDAEAPDDARRRGDARGRPGDPASSTRACPPTPTSDPSRSSPRCRAMASAWRWWRPRSRRPRAVTRRRSRWIATLGCGPSMKARGFVAIGTRDRPVGVRHRGPSARSAALGTLTGRDRAAARRNRPGPHARMND